jgi:hypothetical protein
VVVDRRKGERRVPPSEHLDVTRLEHENLCNQVDEVLRILMRIEAELRAQSERIKTLEENTSIRRQAS